MSFLSEDVAENASVAFKIELFEYMTKCFKEAQRTMTKMYEAELSTRASGKAELQSEMAEVAAPKPRREQRQARWHRCQGHYRT